MKKENLLKKVVKSKQIFNKNKATLVVKEHTPAEYVNRFFKDELEEMENALFFKK